MHNLPQTVADVEALAVAFLRLSRSRRLRRRWLGERRQCRMLLRECRRPGYGGSADALHDLDWLEDLFASLIREGVTP